MTTETKKTTQREKLAKGMAWLTIGNFTSRLLGIVYLIPWYMWLGEHKEEANALFNMGYQIYANFLLISTVGLPIALAKQIAKYNVLNQEEVSYYLVKEFFKLMVLLGAAFAGIMYLSSPFLADISGSKELLVPVMYSLVPPLFVFPAMSILRGFFQGHHDMRPYALSQIVEQLVRVIWILASTFYIMKLGSGDYLEAVVQSTFAAFIGMIASIGILFYALWKQGYLTKLVKAQQPSVSVDTRQLIIETLRQAIPVIILGMAIQLFQFVDQVTFIRLMEQVTDYSNAQLLKLYSYMVSNPSKITMLIIAIANSLGSVAIPLITEKFVKRDFKATSELIADNLQMLFIFTIPAVVGAVLLAKPLYSVFYGPSTPLAITLFIMSVLLVLVQNLYVILNVIIQALFENRRAILYFAIGIVVKVVLQAPAIYLFQVYGSFVSTVLGFVVILLLFYRRINQVVEFDKRIVVKDMLTISWISAAMGLVVWLLELLLDYFLPVEGYLSALIHVGISGSVGVIIFIILTLKTRQLDKLIGERANSLRKRLRMK